jgi:hypothetical protein
MQLSTQLLGFLFSFVADHFVRWVSYTQQINLAASPTNSAGGASRKIS